MYNWRARRPQASDESVRLYVRTLAEALSAPTDRDENKRLRSIIARQVEPFARALAPQLLPVLEATVPAVDVERGLSRLFPESSFDKYLAQAAQSENSRERTQAKIFHFRSLWRAGKFDEAVVLASEIEDAVLRSHVDQLIFCGRAARAIQEEDLELAYI
ncbi:MAG: hypothetical protein GY953_40715, partial [bacterium]|nr:hypothetical protein [bacterium]